MSRISRYGKNPRRGRKKQQPQPTHGFTSGRGELPPGNHSPSFNSTPFNPGGSSHHPHVGVHHSTNRRGRGGRRQNRYGRRSLNGDHHGGGGGGGGDADVGGGSSGVDGSWHLNNHGHHRNESNRTRYHAQQQQNAVLPFRPHPRQTIQQERGQEIAKIKTVHQYGRQLKSQFEQFLQLLEDLLMNNDKSMEMDWEFTGAVLYFPTQ